jgi:hypothetical protein
MSAAARIVGLILCVSLPGARAGAAALAAPMSADFAALVAAGGGFDHFRTLTLIGVLAAPNANVEVAALTKRFGAQAVKTAIATADFAVADARRLAPAPFERARRPATDAISARALIATLIADGTSGRSGFTIERLSDRLVTHGVHARIERDVRAMLGPNAGPTFRAVATQTLRDIAAARTQAINAK